MDGLELDLLRKCFLTEHYTLQRTIEQKNSRIAQLNLTLEAKDKVIESCNSELAQSQVNSVSLKTIFNELKDKLKKGRRFS